MQNIAKTLFTQSPYRELIVRHLPHDDALKIWLRTWIACNKDKIPTLNNQSWYVYDLGKHMMAMQMLIRDAAALHEHLGEAHYVQLLTQQIDVQLFLPILLSLCLIERRIAMIPNEDLTSPERTDLIEEIKQRLSQIFETIFTTIQKESTIQHLLESEFYPKDSSTMTFEPLLLKAWTFPLLQSHESSIGMDDDSVIHLSAAAKISQDRALLLLDYLQQDTQQRSERQLRSHKHLALQDLRQKHLIAPIEKALSEYKIRWKATCLGSVSVRRLAMDKMLSVQTTIDDLNIIQDSKVNANELYQVLTKSCGTMPEVKFQRGLLEMPRNYFELALTHLALFKRLWQKLDYTHRSLLFAADADGRSAFHFLCTMGNESVHNGNAHIENICNIILKYQPNYYTVPNGLRQLSGLIIPNKFYKTYIDWLDEEENDDGTYSLVEPVISLVNAYTYAARGRDCFPMIELAINHVSAGMDNDLIKSYLALVARLDSHSLSRKDFFVAFINIFKATKAYAQSLDTMNTISHDPNYIAAQKQWHHAETAEQKIDIAKTYFKKNSVLCADFAEPLWFGTTDSQLRWSNFFFNDPAVVIVEATSPAHGQDEIYGTYSRWLRAAITWSLRGSSDFYQETTIDIIQVFQNNGFHTLQNIFRTFTTIFSNQLTTFFLAANLSASSLAFTFIHCCSELDRRGVLNPHTVLWSRCSPEDSSRMIANFLDADMREKDKMRCIKIGSSTVITTFARLVRDEIINHLHSNPHMDNMWVLLEINPFNLVRQGNFRLLSNAIHWAAEKNGTAKGYAIIQRHIEATPVEDLLKFIKSEYFAQTLFTKVKINKSWLYCLFDRLSPEQLWEVMWEKDGEGRGYSMVFHDIGNSHHYKPDLSCKALNDPRLDDRQKKDILHHLIHTYKNWFLTNDSGVIKYRLSVQGMESSESAPHPLLSMETTHAEYQQWLETCYNRKRKAPDSEMTQQPTRLQTTEGLVGSSSLWQQSSSSSSVEDSIQHGPL